MSTIENLCNTTYPIVALAYMAFPRDEAKREQFGQTLVASFATNAVEDDEEICLPRSAVSGILAAAANGAANGLSDAAVGGFMAGEVLLYVLRMRDSGVEAPSLDKAHHLTGAHYVSSKKYGGGSYRGAGRDTVRKHWEAFRTVGHLWAAWLLISYSCPTDRDRAAWMADHFHVLPGLAHGIYEDAVTYLPPQGREPILSPDRAWRLIGVQPLPYVLPPLTEFEREVLATFRPRARGN